MAMPLLATAGLPPARRPSAVVLSRLLGSSARLSPRFYDPLGAVLAVEFGASTWSYAVDVCRQEKPPMIAPRSRVCVTWHAGFRPPRGRTSLG